MRNMILLSRPTELRDLPDCTDLLQGGFLYSEQAKHGLISMWTHLLLQGRAISGVVEAREPGKPQIVGFGSSVFVTDQFVNDARTTQSPYWPCQFLTRWMQRPCPILDQRQVEIANAGEGPNLLGLHYGWSNGVLPAEKCCQVRSRLLEQFRDSHRSYNIKGFIKEIYGTEERDRYLRLGTAVRTDYAQFDD